jgi:hypothetical protein
MERHFVDVGRMVRRATNDFVEFLVITYGDQFEAFSNSILGILVWIERLLLGRSEPEIILLIVFGGLISLFVYLISKNSRLGRRLSSLLRRRCFSSRATRPLWVRRPSSRWNGCGCRNCKSSRSSC